MTWRRPAAILWAMGWFVLVVAIGLIGGVGLGSAIGRRPWYAGGWVFLGAMLILPIAAVAGGR